MLGTCTEVSVSSGKNPDLFERGDEGETKKRCVIAEIELGVLIMSHHNEFRAGAERWSDYPISSSSSVQVCQVWVYSGRGSGQVWTETDRGRRQRAGQEVSPARVGYRVDSTTKDNER